MSEKKKDCRKHRCEDVCRRVCCCVGVLVVAVLIAVFVIWLVLRPTKPLFCLQRAEIYTLNLSSTEPPLLSTTLQVTIASRNPNHRIGIYYDRMVVYATYQWQQVTGPNNLPRLYQGCKDYSVWSPSLRGNDVPIAPYLTQKLKDDRTSGVILLHVKIRGKVRWKVGSWTSGRYHLDVNCPALLSYSRHRISSIKYLTTPSQQKCSVDV